MAKQSANKLALLGGKAVGPVKHLRHPVFTKRAKQAVADLLDRGRTVGLSRSGSPEIKQVDAAISRYHGGRHALGTGSGHAALHLAVCGLDIGPGDEVITTPYTWGASISCILHQGAIPVFCDVDRHTGLLDPGKIETLITPRTRGILAVHIYGQPANMPRIMKIAKKHGLVVIEDGSQAHGATWKGKVVGNFGDAAGFSCMGGKLLATAEAGYMVTPHADVYWRACLTGQHMGRRGDPGFPDKFRPYVDSLVYTYRLSPVIAVLLREQLRKLNREVEYRQQNVDLLRQHLADSKYIRFPNYGKSSRPSYHMLTMNFEAKKAGISRDTFARAVGAEGLGLGHYVPSPITTWERLQWRGYKGPKTSWMDNLRRAKTNYAAVEVPNCQYKIDHALEMGFNFYRPAAKAMAQMAQIVYKVEANIDALRAYGRSQSS